MVTLQGESQADHRERLQILRNKRREVYDCFARRPDDFVLIY